MDRDGGWRKDCGEEAISGLSICISCLESEGFLNGVSVGEMITDNPDFYVRFHHQDMRFASSERAEGG